MLPGVVLPPGGIPALGSFKKGDPRSIIIHGTKYIERGEKKKPTMIHFYLSLQCSSCCGLHGAWGNGAGTTGNDDRSGHASAACLA